MNWQAQADTKSSHVSSVHSSLSSQIPVQLSPSLVQFCIIMQGSSGGWVGGGGALVAVDVAVMLTHSLGLHPQVFKLGGRGVTSTQSVAVSGQAP